MFTRVDSLPADLGNGVHKLASDEFMVALTNIAPTPSDSILADIDEIEYRCSSRVLMLNVKMAGKRVTVRPEDVELIANGKLGPFRYIAVYNDSSKYKALIGYSDYGQTVTLQTDDALTIRFEDDLLQFG